MVLASEIFITPKEVLDIATRIGYFLLKHGAEINRVEDTAKRICTSYGMDSANIFAIASSIVITVEHEGSAFTQTRRVTEVDTNLDRVEQLNALSRKICSQTPNYSEVLREINRIEDRHLYPPIVSCAAYAVIGGAFAVFFGGNIYDCACAFITGFIIRLIMLLMQFMLAPAFFVNTLASAAVVICVHIAELMFPQVHAETTTIGVLMNLVPGVLLTNCIRDFVSNDFTSGISRIIEAFFVAAAIALGVAVSFIWR